MKIRFNDNWLTTSQNNKYVANQLMRLAYNLTVQLIKLKQQQQFQQADNIRDLLRASDFIVEYKQDGSVYIRLSCYA